MSSSVNPSTHHTSTAHIMQDRISLEGDAAASTPAAVQRLVQEIQDDQQKSAQQQQQQDVKLITPKPGFCIKTDIESGEKVFLNICHSEDIPAPPSISDEELALVIANEDGTRFRIPMSVGPPHMEPDNTGTPCRAFDAIVNSSVVEQLNEREGMREFVVELVMCQVEAKHNLALNRVYKVMKRRKSMGKPVPQMCRVKRKIRDVSTKDVTVVSEDDAKDSEWKGPQPKYEMYRDPEHGHPEFLVFEFHLDKLRSARTVALDVGEERLVVHARPNVYYIDIDIKWPLRPNLTVAQFNRRTRILTVTCVVASPP
ncbi:hypothetical protein PTSG_08040 [Salpingoeca rosetta]|uniref:PIH1 domain-containing protein 1 n=1 Tax=Salpingoeca rosetta (strain ATCC 50818 / BSB-021) TaxID=946362 RepID=F2UHU0_SALR5|nr:uncharacterized protein PTSG_08040 [Salpingoeca rosetta]EGD76689.1 hypothetical protein PTSG_08040 [Salpingoeca rosetta]|eukprot:XP_004991061.1 hypothetical protein PTSG_08040 [Salpingoeca rosetta]